MKTRKIIKRISLFCFVLILLATSGCGALASNELTSSSNISSWFASWGAESGVYQDTSSYVPESGTTPITSVVSEEIDPSRYYNPEWLSSFPQLTAEPDSRITHTEGTPNTVIITKPYTKQEIAAAEKALEPIMKTLYLSEDSPVRKAISDGNVPDNMFDLSYAPFPPYDIPVEVPPIPDLERILAVHNGTGIYGIADSGKFEVAPRLVLDGLQTHTVPILYGDTKEFLGKTWFKTDGETWKPGGGGRYLSEFTTTDFKIHAVEIYAQIRKTKLDLEKTSAKFFLSDFSDGYFLTDGATEYVMTIGQPGEMSPFYDRFNGGGFDAGRYVLTIEVDDFIEIATEHAAALRAYHKIINPTGESGLMGANNIPADFVWPESAVPAGSDVFALPTWGYFAIAGGIVFAVIAAAATNRKKNSA